DSTDVEARDSWHYSLLLRQHIGVQVMRADVRPPGTSLYGACDSIRYFAPRLGTIAGSALPRGGCHGSPRAAPAAEPDFHPVDACAPGPRPRGRGGPAGPAPPPGALQRGDLSLFAGGRARPGRGRGVGPGVRAPLRAGRLSPGRPAAR